MKDTPFTYQFFAAIAAACFFVPFAIIMIKGLVKRQVFVWFGIYWMLAGMVNLLCMSETFAGSGLKNVTERVFNLSDAPFMLFILYKTVQVETIQNSIKKMLPAFLCMVLLITISTRLPDIAETLMVGGGLLIILMYITWIIIYYSKGIRYNSTAFTQQFIYYALLFEYGISVITFIFSYIIPEQRNVNDSFLIYHLSIIVSISMASYGLIRHKEMPKEKKARMITREREAEIKFL